MRQYIKGHIESRWARPYVTLCVLLLFIVACSSDGTLEEEQRLDLRQPMVFGSTVSSTATEVTRATALQDAQITTFKVGTWKAFGQTGQQNVMDGYQVKYSSTAIIEESYDYHWHYEDIGSQIRRYWDLGAFPYDFRAVAPFISEATITSDGLTINASFQAQSLVNDAYNVSASDSEPCVAAHVTREKDGSNYKDTDKIKNTEINTDGKADATREVHMPFHHLMSKIGFRIFIDNPQPVRPDWQADYGVWIENIVITVKKVTPETGAADGFITEGTSYTASNTQGLQKGTFTGTATNEEFIVLSHDGYTQETQNLHNHLNKTDALDLSPNCMHQIPQQNVKVHVVLKIKTNHVETEEQEFNYDTWLSLDPTNEAGDLFTWEPEKKYIYYLHIPNLHGHDIYLHTCEILPWDDVQTTDIPVGL